ncbi:porin family protein [Cryomorphaceae bacterium 1068]|nr:porin family protein [Cryomorphaceae bacterium 1068]
MRLVLFGLMFFTLPLWGQTENDDKSFSFFLQAGMNASQVGGDGLQGFDKLNFAAGIGVKRIINEKFDWQLGINLLQKGSRKVADPDNGDLTEYKMSLLYAQVPILFEYKYNEKISAIGGTGFGFLLSAEETDFNGVIDNTPDFNVLDFSLILAVKYNISERFGAELRYDQSLLPIRTRGDIDIPLVLGSQFNTVLGVLLSYSIN